MTITFLLYAMLLVLFTGTAIYLVMRDLNAAAQEREEQRKEAEPQLVRLAEPVAEIGPPGFTNRIDHGLRRLMYQTGTDISAEAAFLLCVLCGLTLGGSLFVWREQLPLGIVGFFLGAAVPLFVFITMRRQRMTLIRQQLPDAMDLMARSVRAGETMDQAIESVGRSDQDPLSLEFRRCGRQLEMGLSVPAALRSLTHRAPLTEMRILATTLNVQRRTGGNLAVMLDRLSGVIRDRLSYQRQFMASTGASRMATIMIALAGPVVFTYMMIAQPDYMGQFFTLPGGNTLLGIACILQVCGLIWVANLLRNDY